MGTRKSPGREEISTAIAQALEPMESVHALWEAGAASFDRIDKWSDIDLNVDADDDSAEEVFDSVDRTLAALAPIEVRFRVPYPPDHSYQQVFYRLKRTSKFLLIDFAVFRHSPCDKFLEPEVHGPARFLFRKESAVEIPHLDPAAHVEQIMRRVERIRMRRALFGPFVEKEIGRGNWIEAIYNYNRVILDSLLEVLRMRHLPERFGFGFRYVHYELPPAVLRRLEPLYFVRDRKDLVRKYRTADRWLGGALATIDAGKIERELRARAADK